MFYTRRFCAACAVANKGVFPLQVQQVRTRMGDFITSLCDNSVPFNPLLVVTPRPWSYLKWLKVPWVYLVAFCNDDLYVICLLLTG
jgi:hypothetical protein